MANQSFHTQKNTINFFYVALWYRCINCEIQNFTQSKFHHHPAKFCFRVFISVMEKTMLTSNFNQCKREKKYYLNT